ncbi:MAG: biphenyl 2,3-dioxygenase [Acidobacteria bacterium]|nr:biphenyl 2,3-dioxygenase [Acidobacteriota bacterium]
MIRFRVASAWALLALVPSLASAQSAKTLESSDFVGISFWLISMALVAATAFFFLETQRVAGKWKTSLTVSGLVTLVAATHYFYMREVWIATGSTPTVYRYIDWLITVPLLITEFHLILSAIGRASSGIFWRLIGSTTGMLVAGYVGEAGYVGVWPAFIVSMLFWFAVLYEIFAGEASKAAAGDAPASVQAAYKTMRLIVTFGWAVYPIGYFVGYLTGGNPADSMGMLNIVYNFADVVNKIAFGVIIWSVAVSETEGHK